MRKFDYEGRNSLATVRPLSCAATAIASACLVIASIAPASGSESSASCKRIADDRVRLDCYDRVHGHEPERHDRAGEVSSAPTRARPDRAGGPTLSTVWELDPEDKRGTFRLLPYRANYLLPVRYSSRPNLRPNSPSANHAVSFDLPLDAVETKFQLSARIKAWENMFGDNGDLWFAYTQQSNWQVFNSDDRVSSAFRETNYEPELIVSLRADANMFGWRWRLLNLGFVHQSNGRGLPLSRSWNRIYAQFGLERGNFALLVRPWLRLPEDDAKDDNPDIRDYLGSGDFRLTYARSGHVYSALGRYSFSGNRGFLQLDWAFPISGALKGYVQATHGYGESLIDYNQSQTTIGVGMLLVPWQ